MTDRALSILSCRETLFFRHVAGPEAAEPVLGQQVQVTIANTGPEPVAARVVIAAGGEEIGSQLDIASGIAEYACFGPAFWPDRAPDAAAAIRLEAKGAVVVSTTPLGHHRPWTFYLLSDVCTDCTWVYDSEDDVRRDDAALTAAEMDVAERVASGPHPQESHYNLVHAREADYFLEIFPEQAERFFGHVRKGTIGFNPFFNLSLTCAMSLEELIRQFYPARDMALREGLDLGYANHQETPTMAWIMPTVLAGSGIGHLVKSILPYECPWAARLEDPPLFFWEGPDGNRVLVRRRNTDYVEGNFVLRSLRHTNTALHDRIAPGYEALGDDYPFDAIALVGLYGDLDRVSAGWPARKAATVGEYTAQGWAYPKLIDASHKQFWDDIDAQIASRGVPPPVVRGDFGTSWDAWPACLAHDAAGWRRAQERAATADRLAVIASCLDEDWRAGHKETLAEGWRNLTFLADHAWNGANDANRALNARLRRQWQTTANACFDTVVTDGLTALAAHVPGGDGSRILVFNSLGWERTGVVRVENPAGTVVTDVATAKPVPAQMIDDGGHAILVFEAGDVPSVGYRTYAIGDGADDVAAPSPFQSGETWLDGPLYRVEASTVTGGIVSVFDKVRGRELVDAQSVYHLNQCLYWSDGEEHTPLSATVEIASAGPVLAELRVRAVLKNTELTSTITLYANIDRVDIRNELHKQPTSERQELDFAFPFAVPGRRFRFEAPGVFVEAGRDQLPGSGQAVTAVRHVVDVANDDFGVTLSQADSFLVEFGHRTTLEDPVQPDPSNSTVLALALDNVIDWDESIRDQNGIDRFTFRYSLRGHDGFDPVAAVRFGWEDNNELLAVPLAIGGDGDLPPDVHSFAAAEPAGAILTALKIAEDEGIVARLWNCAGQDAEATLDVSGLISARPSVSAWQTDLLERDLEEIPVQHGRIAARLPAHGIAAVRFSERPRAQT